MVLSSIEILALIVVVIAVIKLVVVLIKPKAWYNGVIRPIYSVPTLTTIVAFILAVVVLTYLISQLTMTQIFASMLFVILLMVMSFATFSKEVLAMAQKLYKEGVTSILRRAWFQIIIWLILLIWVVREIFIV